MCKKFAVLFILILTNISSLYAQEKELTLNQIYTNRQFYGKSLNGVQWFHEGEKYSFLKYDIVTKSPAVFQYDVKSGTESILVSGADLKLNKDDENFSIMNYEWSPDEKYILFTGVLPARSVKPGGAFYLYEVTNKKFFLLADSELEQVNPLFSPDGEKLAFVRGNNIFVINIKTGKEKQLTFDGNDNILNGVFDWVYEEEFSIIQGLNWSPDSKSLAYWKMDQSNVPKIQIAKWDSVNFNFLDMHYPKSGMRNSIVKIGVVDIESGKNNFMDIGTNEDIYIPRMQFTEDPKLLSIQRLNRLQNKFEILFADISTGKTKVIYTEEDSTWIEISDDMTFLKNKKEFIISSEKDGYNHFYLLDYNGKIKQITKGNWEDKALVAVDEKNNLLYYSSYERSPIALDVYSINLDGSGKTRLTTEQGNYTLNISPSFKYYIQRFTSSRSLAAVTLNSIDTKKIKDLIVPDNTVFETYGFTYPEFFTFKTSDGVDLYASLIKPKDFDPSKKYPVLVYNYSGPGSQSVIDRAGGPDYIWYQYLAKKGYLVFVLDNRGTCARGKSFKTIVYKNLGKWESFDLIEGAKYLQSLPYVDPARIGIWGWSYGGYMAAYSMLKGADYFKMGIAVAPVTDWHFYDNIYTERFMSLPALNPVGYKESSVIENADLLKGKLLVIHGTADDNVHFQNSVKLIEKFVEFNKPVDVMFYPEKDHGIYGGNTRLHLYEKLTNYILQNL